MMRFTLEKLTGLSQEMLKKQKKICSILGAIFIIVGILCLVAPIISSVIISAFVGWAFLIGGVFQCAAAIFFKELGDIWAIILSVLIGLAYIFVGGSFIAYPGLAVISLSFIIGVLFFSSGVVRLLVSFLYTPPVNGKWLNILSAALEIFLGVLIINGSPLNAAFYVATVMGIQLIVNGMTYFSIGKFINRHITSTP